MLVVNNHKKSYLKKQIKKQLFFNTELSCTELSDLIHKSLPLTTQYINELLETNEVVEKGFALSTGGRRPQIYALQSNSFYILSVAMDQLVTRVALINEHNEIAGAIEKYELPLSNNPNALPQLADILESFIKSRKVDASKIIGAGIGMPGFIDTKKGINYSFLPTEKGSVSSYLQDRLAMPVLIDNDSSLIALAELKWGAARNKQNVMVINIGWGVGLGIIANGSLFRGHDGFAGEFSHIPLFDNNKLCSCGKYGCLETETSLVFVAKKAIEGLNRSQPSSLKNLSADRIEEAAKKIIEAAQKGDKFSIEVLSESAYNIGRGVAILIHLLNPELVVISGIGSQAGKAWIAPIQQAINEHCIPKIAENTEITISTLGYNAELTGAAALVMDNYEVLKTEAKTPATIN